MIAHSHQDAGWLMTAEQYYNTHVNKIFTEVFKALQSNPKRKFTHAEIAFFEMWWRDQSNENKTVFRQLVANGQFEFVSGGWVASDEACPIYTEILENIRVGHDFLKREFDLSPPKYAWHMDSFGHSSTTAKLFKELGFEAFFYSRMNETQKDEFKRD